MRLIFKYTLAFFAGGIFVFCLFAYLSTFIRPQALDLSAASLKVSVIKFEDENFIAVTGPPFNALGAHQYLAYSVTDDKIEIGFFVTRLTLSGESAFQTDWPLLIPQSKLLSQRVRLTCKGQSGEEPIATILQTGDNLEIQSVTP